MALNKPELQKIQEWMISRMTESEKQHVYENHPNSLKTDGLYGELVPRLKHLINILSEVSDITLKEYKYNTKGD